MIQQSIGTKIKNRRRQIKLSQEQLALMAGVTPTYLGQIERGERNPTIGFLEKIAVALNVDIIYFFQTESLSSSSAWDEHICCSVAKLNEQQKEALARVVDAVIDTMKS